MDLDRGSMDVTWTAVSVTVEEQGHRAHCGLGEQTAQKGTLRRAGWGLLREAHGACTLCALTASG